MRATAMYLARRHLARVERVSPTEAQTVAHAAADAPVFHRLGVTGDVWRSWYMGRWHVP